MNNGQFRKSNYIHSSRSFKIPKMKSEFVNRRRTDNRKRTKGQTTIYKTLHIKLKMELHEPH